MDKKIFTRQLKQQTSYWYWYRVDTDNAPQNEDTKIAAANQALDVALNEIGMRSYTQAIDTFFGTAEKAIKWAIKNIGEPLPKYKIKIIKRNGETIVQLLDSISSELQDEKKCGKRKVTVAAAQNAYIELFGNPQIFLTRPWQFTAQWKAKSNRPDWYLE